MSLANGDGLLKLCQLLNVRREPLFVVAEFGVHGDDLLDLLKNQDRSPDLSGGHLGFGGVYPGAHCPVVFAIELAQLLQGHDVKKLADLDVDSLQPCIEFDVSQPLDIRLRMEFAPTETEVHRERIDAEPPLPQDLLSSLATKVMAEARLANVFSQLYPLVRRYVAERCFGRAIDLEDKAVRSHLQTPVVQECIARYLTEQIGRLTVVSRKLEFEHAAYQLSQTKPFVWRRNLKDGPLECTRTIFNYVATYNDFERLFGQFLNGAKDVLRFAALGTTQQGESRAQFRVDYLKPNGAIGFYHPDWVVVQSSTDGEINWIIETKGRVWEDTEAKDAAMADWCSRVTARTAQQWRYARVNQADFDARRPTLFAQAVSPPQPPPLA